MLRRPGVRAFPTFGRRHLTTSSGAKHFPNGTTYTAYRVRFRDPPQFTRFVSYAVPVWLTWNYILPLAIEFGFSDDAAGAVGEDGSANIERNNKRVDNEDSEELDEDTIFIPAGWPTKQPRTFYKASDPEWQEFRKLSKDSERIKAAQVKLVLGIRDEIARHPNADRVFGQVDRKKGRWWIDVIFPDGPPQDYTISGIEIADDFIAWSKKEMTQEEYHKLTQTILPTAAMWSLWATTRYHLEVRANQLRQFFGIAPKWNPQIQKLQHAISTKEGMSSGLGSQQKGQSFSTASRTVDSPNSGTGSQASAGGEKTEPATSTNTEQKNVGLPNLPTMNPSGEKKHPITLMLFMSTMASQRKKYALEPPRGSVLYAGLVEIIGTKGRSTIDVTAAYDPKTDEFSKWSWHARTVQPKTQYPKGGR